MMLMSSTNLLFHGEFRVLRLGLKSSRNGQDEAEGHNLPENAPSRESRATHSERNFGTDSRCACSVSLIYAIDTKVILVQAKWN